MSDLELRPVPYLGAAAAELIGELQAEYVVRYGGPDDTVVEPDEFAPPEGGFYVAYLDGTAVGCGGFRRFADGVAEIKRMYVREAWRRHGLGRRLLAGLEEAVAGIGYAEIRLMTGQAQPEAISLYETSGYHPSATPYGVYADAPGARFFEKRLRA